MFVFVRHGQTNGNLKLLKNYTDDTPLNEIGIMEAIESGIYLKNNIFNNKT